MAILNSLLVNGSGRVLNKLYVTDLEIANGITLPSLTLILFILVLVIMILVEYIWLEKIRLLECKLFMMKKI